MSRGGWRTSSQAQLHPKGGRNLGLNRGPLGRDSIQRGVIDHDLLRATAAIAKRQGDYALAAKAVELLLPLLPQGRAAAYLDLGHLYHSAQLNDPVQALEAYRMAIKLTAPAQRASLQAEIPASFWVQLGLTASAPAVSTQTSANSR